MLNEQNGDLLLDNGLSIGPKLNLNSFKNSVIFKDSIVVLENSQWCTYKLNELVLSGETFIIILYFHNSILNKLEMVISDLKLGQSWNDWSKENEIKRDQRHKAWVNKNFGIRRKFSWGNIWVGFDEKSGGSLIQINYNQSI